MRRILGSFIAAAALGLLAACGGGGGGSSGGDLCNPLVASCGTSSSSPSSGGLVANSLNVRVSATTLQTDGASSIKIYVMAKDASNAALVDQLVTLSVDSGTLSKSSGKTDSNGMFEASFDSNDNKQNRTVTLTATSGSLVEHVTISVQGTKVSFGGDSSAVTGQQASVSVSVKDAANQGVPNTKVSLSSSLGNPIPASVTTDSTGVASFQYTPSVSGSDVITAVALGDTKAVTIAASGINFRFTSPAAGASVSLGACQTVKVTGSGFPFGNVYFGSSRGKVYGDSGCATELSDPVPVSGGQATAYVKSTSAGAATLTATADDTNQTVAKLGLKFVATTPASVSVQGSPTTVRVGESTALTALVRDASGNPVANKIVDFSAPDGGGQTNPTYAMTDDSGVATSTFIADSTLSGKDSVTVKAVVRGTTVTGTASLTVSGLAVNIRLGTDNVVVLVENPPRYRKVYGAAVTDSSGNPVKNQVVTISILGKAFEKGTWTKPGLYWVKNSVSTCQAEDGNNNGVIDAGEVGDADNDGVYEPNGAATVRPPDGASGTSVTVTTDSSGYAAFWVEYFRDHASWAQVELKGTASVYGQNSVGSAVFWLPVSGDEVNDGFNEPSFVRSPFGILSGCTVH